MPGSAVSQHSSSLKLRRIRVRPGKLDLEMEVPLELLHVSGPAAGRVLALLPNLARHVCINEKGASFGDEIVGTELAHLLEHVVVELEGQAHAAAGDGPVFLGHTSWLEELDRTRAHGYALMRTTVTFLNDFVALQAVKDACDIVGWACGVPGSPDSRPDVPAMVEGLRHMM